MVSTQFPPLCSDAPCCLFWVYNPATLACEGYTNCNRTDNQPTVREWFGDWKVLNATCRGYFPVSRLLLIGARDISPEIAKESLILHRVLTVPSDEIDKSRTSFALRHS